MKQPFWKLKHDFLCMKIINMLYENRCASQIYNEIRSLMDFTTLENIRKYDILEERGWITTKNGNHVFIDDGSSSGGNSPAEKKVTEIRRNIIQNQKIAIVPRQAIHRQGTKMYYDRQAKLKALNQYGPPYLTISDAEVLELVNKYKGKGTICLNANLQWDNKETVVTNNKIVGVCVNNLTGKSVTTSVFTIHYSQKGFHVVPDYPSKKKG